MRTNTELPLYSFFDALRKNGFSLGIEEYYVLVEALQLGWGIDRSSGNFDKGSLLVLCKTIWYKSKYSSFVFESLFEEHYQLLDYKSLLSEHTSKAKDGLDEKSMPEKSEQDLPFPDDINDQEGDGLSSPDENNDQNEELDSNEIDDRNLEKKRYDSVIKGPHNESYIKVVLGNKDGIKRDVEIDKTKSSRKFFLADYYFDLTKRQMQQVCRFLPLTQEAYDRDEIDIEACVHEYAKNGILIEPVYHKKAQIANNILLLVDHEGSMIAFNTLVDTFSEALKDAFKQDQHKIKQYYFYNTPTEYCYLNKAHTKFKKTTQILNKLSAQHSMVIIISDGGAARGGNSDGRFRAVLRFIISLKKKTQKIIWLNPMPKKRWENTTAERIARFIPMFSLSSQHELHKAINTLRGKSD